MKQRPLRLNVKHLSHFLVLSLMLITVLVAFQNCSEPLSSEDELASVAATTPFAFDTRIDTIAHLSCNYSGATDVGSYFTFKAGAYRFGSGLRYTDAFISSTGGYTPEKRAKVLDHESSQSAGLSFALGVLFRTNLDTSSNMGAFTPVLSSPAVVLQLPQIVGSTSRVNTFGGQFLSSSFLIPTNNVPAFRNYAQVNDVPSGNINQDPRVILSQYYTKDGQSVATGDGGARGSAFYVNFAAPNHISSTSGNSVENHNIVSGITEKTLVGREGPATGLWSCVNYLIVRNQEQGWNTATNVGVGSSTYNELRALLPEQSWVIDLSTPPGGRNYAGYIVPKLASCYGNNSNQGSNSQGSVPHYFSGDGFQGDCNVDQNGQYSANNTCPHYLTVCKRN